MIGTTVSHYRVLERIGRGAMGEVYLAKDLKLKRNVALKLLAEDVTADLESRQRFLREARAAAAVNHPGVAAVYDIEEVEAGTIIVMEYVQGRSLREIVSQRRVPLEEALELGIQVSEALARAHELGVVHRDLKPENVLVLEDGSTKIIDFGLAKLVAPVSFQGRDESDELSNTATDGGVETRRGQIMGTVCYMSPEQAQGASVDNRTDIFSLGVVLHEILTGRAPFKRANVVETLSSILKDPPPPITLEGGARPPARLRRILEKALAKSPPDRYRTMEELVAELREVKNGLARKPVSWRMVVGAVLLAVVLIAGTWWAALRIPPSVVVSPEPVSVLIADFDNRTGDPAFDGALEQALSIGLEGSPFVTSYPRTQAKQIAGKIRPGSTLDEPMARLISMREATDLVLAGSVERDGSGYSISAHVVDPANGKVIATSEVDASTKSDVLVAVAELAGKLRPVVGGAESKSERLAAAETFTAASLEAVQSYWLAQDALARGRYEDALSHYHRAIEQDPEFGRAYSGAAISAGRLGRSEEAKELWTKALSLMERMTEREKYRTLGTYYLGVARNYEKAVENFRILVEKYPADRAGYSNLALSYFYLHDFPRALEVGRRATEFNPKNALHRSNFALYAMYAGDFATATTETTKVIEQEPGFYVAYLPLAVSELDSWNREGARRAYQRMAQTGSAGASLAAAGLADLALAEGRFEEAGKILISAIASDREAGSTAGAAVKYLALAEAREGAGQTPLALQAVESALSVGRGEEVLFPSAMILLRAGRAAEARQLAAELGSRLPADSRAYGRIIEAQIALHERRTVDAIEVFRDAQELADLWAGRFGKALAYLELGHHAEALAELELCQKRRGEAMALFFDDVPTFRYLAPLPYWLARAQDELGMRTTARDNYRRFLDLRSSASDPLAVDARRRLGGG